jgi:hypothetical protein
MTSAYSNDAALYLENGLSVIPCGPGTKFPGRYTAAEGWMAAYDWQKYCTRLPTGFETSLWDRWPGAGICLALGEASGANGLHLVAMDIDTDVPEEVAAIRSVLPGSPCAKRGAKGETQFYLASAAVVSRPFNDGHRRRILDLLASGRQTVMSPTMHPDCQSCGGKGTVLADAACNACGADGQAYRWITPDTLADFAVADLPVLPDDIADRLAEALAPFGYEAASLTVGAAGNGEIDPNNPHRALNDSALANLGAWVPALQLYGCRQTGGKYKAVAHWRPSSSGRPMSKRATNLAISGDGIKDCGENKGYTPLDLVMAACGTDLDTAFAWLQERVAPHPILQLKASPAPVEAPEQPEEPRRRGNLSGVRLAAVDGVALEADEEITEPDEEAPEGLPGGLIAPDLCTPPGLIGDVVEWMNGSADRPLPQANLGAALAFLGSLMGRRFEGPTRARTNLYCVGVAPTGRGKNHPLTAITELATSSGVDGFLGPEGIKSETAIRKLLENKPTVVCMIDEMGEFIKKIMSKRASAHESGIRAIMLSIFSKANTTYHGSEGAMEKANPIRNPNFCVYGTSTPEDLWTQFSTGNADDGFLPRWLVFDGGDKRVRPVTPEFDVSEPPRELAKKLHALLDVRPPGNLNGTGMVNKPIRATWGDGAQDMFAALQDEMEDRMEEAKADRRFTEQKVASRFAEHTIKLALIYAVGSAEDMRQPVISCAALHWARAVVESSSIALTMAIEGKIADSDIQAQYLWVLGAIRDAGPDGILESALLKMVRGRWDQRRHGDILGQLAGAGEIWRGIRAPAHGGRPGARVGAWGLEEKAG